MYIRLKRIVPASQLVVIHAVLPEVDWSGTVEHIEATIEGPLVTCTNKNKTFLSMVEARGMFPDAHRRQCTSDLKRDPINSKIRAIMSERGATIAVNCTGIRAQESTNRAKAEIFAVNKRLSKAGRTVYDWLPIHKMKIDEVFATIAAAGESPHWAYSKGMSRLSCSFCIMANSSDLRIAAQLRPDLYRRYVEIEARIGHTLQMSKKTLPEITGINP